MSRWYSDDPVQDAERYAAMQDRYEERHRIGRCAECGEYVHDYDDRYDFGDKIIHEDCILSWVAQFKK